MCMHWGTEMAFIIVILTRSTVKTADMCPVVQPCGAAACTLLHPLELLPTCKETSHTDHFLTLATYVKELILDIRSSCVNGALVLRNSQRVHTDGVNLPYFNLAHGY